MSYWTDTLSGLLGIEKHGADQGLARLGVNAIPVERLYVALFQPIRSYLSNLTHVEKDERNPDSRTFQLRILGRFPPIFILF